jgi:hypothetical protein
MIAGQAAEAVTDRLSWQYALGLGLGDEGFDHTVLSEFRSRVVAHGLEEHVLDALLKRLASEHLVAVGGKQRTDPAHVISAVRDLNCAELIGEPVRACLEALAAAAPGWLRDLPAAQVLRVVLVQNYVRIITGGLEVVRRRRAGSTNPAARLQPQLQTQNDHDVRRSRENCRSGACKRVRRQGLEPRTRRLRVCCSAN